MKQTIIRWMQEQVRETKTKGIVLGLSGGIDSSVCAALAREAVGEKNVCGLILPCASRDQDADHAMLLTRQLGIRPKKLDLSQVHGTLLALLPSGNRLARSNLKPRLRMLTLYYYANRLNYLVCGTGNKSELMVGYFTKYGDGAVDILPIGGLFKREVVALARELQIPEEIIVKPPSAGLWEHQTDEAEMGVTYDELDDILDRMQRKVPQKQPKTKVARVREMIARSEHKRCTAQICPVKR